MREKIVAFALACVMVLSLTACGEKKDRDDGGTDGSVTEKGGDIGGSGAAEGRTWSSDARSGNRYGYDRTFDNNNGSTFGGIGEKEMPYDDMPGYRTDSTATWEQMLENGRVRDSDGLLKDGENTMW